MGTMWPCVSMILALAWGMTLPTVVRRRSILSVVRALKQVGEASVRPVVRQLPRIHTRDRGMHTVAAGILGHVQFLKQPLHERPGNRRTGDDPRPQVRAVKVGWLWKTQNGLEHGGYAVQGGTFLVRDGVQHGGGIERLTGEDDL